MQYGNCLTGALFLLWKERKNKPKLILRRRIGTRVPHFMVKSKEKLHHYKVEKDLFPWPFCYMMFKGKFETVNISEEADFQK